MKDFVVFFVRISTNGATYSDSKIVSATSLTNAAELVENHYGRNCQRVTRIRDYKFYDKDRSRLKS